MEEDKKHVEEIDGTNVASKRARTTVVEEWNRFGRFEVGKFQMAMTRYARKKYNMYLIWFDESVMFVNLPFHFDISSEGTTAIAAVDEIATKYPSSTFMLTLIRAIPPLKTGVYHLLSFGCAQHVMTKKPDTIFTSECVTDEDARNGSPHLVKMKEIGVIAQRDFGVKIEWDLNIRSDDVSVLEIDKYPSLEAVVETMCQNWFTNARCTLTSYVRTTTKNYILYFRLEGAKKKSLGTRFQKKKTMNA